MESAQAEVLMRTFTLEQVFRGFLDPELAKKELDVMATIRDKS